MLPPQTGLVHERAELTDNVIFENCLACLISPFCELHSRTVTSGTTGKATNAHGSLMVAC